MHKIEEVNFLVIYNIKERLKVEYKLKEKDKLHEKPESEESFRPSSSIAQDAVIQINEHGLIIYWNKSAEKIFGLSETDVLNKNLHQLIAPERYLLAFKEAFKGGKLINNLHVVEDGIEALAYLRKQGKFNNGPTPDLILLDLNLPKKDGRELLAEIKEDQHFKHIPVIVLTTSNAETDITKSYKSHANCYITKPVDMYQFIKIMEYIEFFWSSIVKLPPNKNFA